MRYRAFISYSNADRAIAEKFQRAIEHYRVPRELRGQDHGFGVIPRHVTPLFRDRSDGNADVDLGKALQEALENSDALIVLCSPASGGSKWCGEEIRMFKRLGRAARIFPVLVGGLPKKHDPAAEPSGAFLPALFERYDADGKLAGIDTSEPLAPDLTEAGDGLHFASLKIIAALTGVPLTLLTQRQQEAERREKLVARSIAGGMSVLAVTATVAAVFAWQQWQSAQARMTAAIETAAQRVTDAANYRDQYGVPSEVIKDLLVGAEDDFNKLVPIGGERAPLLGLERGRMLAKLADLYGNLQDNDRQLRLARDSMRSLDQTPSSRSPFSPGTWLASLPPRGSVDAEKLNAFEALGSALSSQEGGAAEADANFRQGLDLAEKMGEPLRVARFWSLIGGLRYSVGEVESALEAHDAALRVLGNVKGAGEAAAAARLDEIYAQTDRAEMLLELERRDEAMQQQIAATAATEKLARESGPEDMGMQVTLAQMIVRRADMRYAATRRREEQIEDLMAAVKLLQQVHKADPARMDYARDLSIAQERLGDTSLVTGNLKAARSAFDDCYALRDRILSRNPLNPDAQRDVAVALERLGDVALANRNARDAAAQYRKAVEMRQAAGQGGDADTVKKRDMSVLVAKRGKARAALGEAGWQADFDVPIATMTPMLESDSVLPGWHRDVAIFHSDFGDALLGANRKRAIAEWTVALELIRQQIELSGEDDQLADDVKQLQAKIAGR